MQDCIASQIVKELKGFYKIVKLLVYCQLTFYIYAVVIILYFRDKVVLA